MSWPALLKGKENVREIEKEVAQLLKESNSFSKKDIVNYKEMLLSQADNSTNEIMKQINDLKKNLKDHRKYLETKSVFLKRHHKHV